MRRRLSMAALAIVPALIAQGAAARALPEAEPTAGPIVTLSTDGASPETVVDGHGTATVVWETDWWRGPIMAARRPAGGTWSRPVVIGRGHNPLIGIDAAGNVTVVIHTNRPGFTGGLTAVRRPQGQPWGTPVRLTVDRSAPTYTRTDEEGTYGAHRTDLAVSPNGDVVVAWQWGSADRNRPFRIEVARRPHGATWTGPLGLTPRNWSDEPEIGVDRTGRATLVYRDGGTTLVSRRLVPGSGWAGPVRLRGTASVLQHDLVVSPQGRTTLLLDDYRDNRVVVAVRERPPTGPWGAQRRLTPEGVGVAESAIAVDTLGRVNVVWTRGTGRIDLVRWRGSWSAPVMVAGPALNGALGLAANGAGDVAVWWHNESLGIRARLRDGSGSWTPRFTAWDPPATGYYGVSTAAVHPDGDALSVVTRGDFVRARRLLR